MAKKQKSPEERRRRTYSKVRHSLRLVKKAIHSAKLKKFVDERDPENILETLVKCANIIKFSHH